MNWNVAERKNEGGLARLESLTADPAIGAEVVRRLAGGESLRQLAESWAVPYKRLVAWIAANGELSEQCTRARELAGVELRIEGLELLDEAADEVLSTERVTLLKARAEYRERLSRDMHKSLFGKVVKHEHSMTGDLGERLRRARQRVFDGEVLDVVTHQDGTPPLDTPPEPAPEPIDSATVVAPAEHRAPPEPEELEI